MFKGTKKIYLHKLLCDKSGQVRQSRQMERQDRALGNKLFLYLRR